MLSAQINIGGGMIFMTKADLVEAVANTCEFRKNESQDIVEEVFALMKNCLENGEDLKISGFGKFTVKSKAPRNGRNPQTGTAIIITPRKVLTFKPSPVLKDLLNDR
jgi:integration host factor subunit alpha